MQACLYHFRHDRRRRNSFFIVCGYDVGGYLSVVSLLLQDDRIRESPLIKRDLFRKLY